MNPQIKQKWIRALPNYKQTRKYLRTEEGFCCLGVLTDLYLKEKGHKWKQEFDNGQVCYTYQECGYDLTNDVVEWAGLPDHDPTVEVNGVTTKLSDLNDGGVSFQEIAELIESSLTEELYPQHFK